MRPHGHGFGRLLRSGLILYLVRFCSSKSCNSTGAGALLRNHLEENALPFELELAFLTAKKLNKETT